MPLVLEGVVELVDEADRNRVAGPPRTDPMVLASLKRMAQRLLRPSMVITRSESTPKERFLTTPHPNRSAQVALDLQL
jgi:hypothetical protein